MTFASGDSIATKFSGEVYMQVPFQWSATLRVPAQQWRGSHDQAACFLSLCEHLHHQGVPVTLTA